MRVLDLTRLLPGAFCTMLLADRGADVIKVEEPGTGDYMRWFPPLVDGQSVVFNSLNRNKRGITLNLKSPEGKELFKRLVAGADVVVEGNRPGVMDRLGLGWEVLRANRPGLVLCSITGYGQDGPFAQRAGHDLNYMATAGVLSLNAPPGGMPHPLAVQVADIGAGGVGAAAAILSALLAVARGGEGQHLDVSMMDGALSWLAMPVAEALGGGERPAAGRTRLTGRYPCYRVYECADGRFLSVGALEPKFWQALVEALDRPDLAGRHLDESPGAHAELETVFRARTRDEWAARLDGLDVCVEPVLEVGEVEAHPQVVARGLVRRERTGTELAPAVPPADGWRRLDPPALGEHNAVVLGELGVDAARLKELAAAGVI
ncbi:MAG TPA: CaiB/BaiF CoA-transferase family protein [Candidatus Dormibacteraeota bacterium]|nr:CaiB/BaiF CoA-transferase family protein [Candidatus Dormibacteraeota bacterium]